jgi:hypothetical protein
MAFLLFHIVQNRSLVIQILPISIQLIDKTAFLIDNTFELPILAELLFQLIPQLK